MAPGTTKKRKGPHIPRVGRLDTVSSVVTELGRLYRAARRGDVPIGDAAKLTYILTAIRAALETSSLEKRLDVLEEEMSDRDGISNPAASH